MSSPHNFSYHLFQRYREVGYNIFKKVFDLSLFNSIKLMNSPFSFRLIKLGLSIDEDEEEDEGESMPDLETDDVADSSTMEEVD